ncbi:hypothetical protein [Spirosoma gilvum]
MKQSFLTTSIILAGIICFTAYGWVLIDWFQDMKSGAYERDLVEVTCETIAILSYCYMAFRFIQIRLRREASTKIDSQTEGQPTEQIHQRAENGIGWLPN